MDIEARLAIFARVPVFAGLESASLRRIAGLAQELAVKRDERLFRQGDQATHGYVVGWGRFRLDQAAAAGQKLILRYLGAGDMLGTVAVFRGIPYPATATAVEDSLLLSWSAPRWADLLRAEPQLAVNVVRLAGQRLEELQQRLQEVATLRVERRIAATLLRLASRDGRPVERGTEIPFALSRQNLAELTATTLHTVSRTLSAWEQEGILEGRRSSHLTILAPDRLREIAGQD